MSAPLPQGLPGIPQPRADAEPARADFIVMDMLARGVPLTLLPDLAWPADPADPTCCGHAGHHQNRFHRCVTRLLTSHRLRASSSIGRAADS